MEIFCHYRRKVHSDAIIAIILVCLSVCYNVRLDLESIEDRLSDLKRVYTERDEEDDFKNHAATCHRRIHSISKVSIVSMVTSFCLSEPYNETMYFLIV